MASGASQTSGLRQLRARAVARPPGSILTRLADYSLNCVLSDILRSLVSPDANEALSLPVC